MTDGTMRKGCGVQAGVDVGTRGSWAWCEEEELAEAIDKDFYDSYKTWTLDNVHASSSQKVCVSDKNKIYNLYPDSSVG